MSGPGTPGNNSLTAEDRATLFGDSPDASETDAARRRRIKEVLQAGGVNAPLTDNELLDAIGELLDRPNPFANEDNFSAENAFRQGLNNPGNPMGNFRTALEAGQGPRAAAFEAGRDATLNQLIAQYMNQAGPAGPKPSVIQTLNTDSVYNSFLSNATGPDPNSLYRDVFQSAFPDISQGLSPFDKFVQGQEKELQARFQQQAFNEFTQPGYIDTLKGDYEALAKQGDSLRMAGGGGTIPSFEDYIKGRVQSNYMTFLAGEKPKLEQAFQMASPQERGQRQIATIAPPRRVL